MNNILQYNHYTKTHIKNIPSRFMNAYTKNYIIEFYELKYINGKLIKNIITKAESNFSYNIMDQIIKNRIL